MRMNDQEYFRSCIAKERHLAQLLGHTHIEECYESAGTLWDNAQALPQWTRDWRACGPLMAAHGISVGYDGEGATLGATHVLFSDHPSRDRALMYGIVKEVIFRLEHQHSPQHSQHHHKAAAEPAPPSAPLPSHA